ncbi:MAG: helix-turn-helix domain-containing protein [Dehalococcoidia bacterium]|nr:helix-turn-helix domain-containing protein [Dehalococcoidia bacterium]
MSEDHDRAPVLTGDDLLLALNALASPHRLRILALLRRQGRTHVSQLARDAGMSRTLLYLHLQRLEAGGLVRGELELSTADGRALKFYEVVSFDLRLTPDFINTAVATLSPPAAKKEED